MTHEHSAWLVVAADCGLADRAICDVLPATTVTEACLVCGHERRRQTRAGEFFYLSPREWVQMQLALGVTPPGGLVLDCFSGSGSVGCSAVRQWYRFVGIDSDAHYCDLARRRLTYWSGQDGPLFRSRAADAPEPGPPAGKEGGEA